MWLSLHNPSDIFKKSFYNSLYLNLMLLSVPLGIVQGGYCYENLCRNFYVLVYQYPEILFLLNVLQHMVTDSTFLLNLVSEMITLHFYILNYRYHFFTYSLSSQPISSVLWHSLHLASPTIISCHLHTSSCQFTFHFASDCSIYIF